MPKGTMLWYDGATGEGRIGASGHEYPVDGRDVEPRARVTGAPVHFDVRRIDGVETAVDVVIRSGTRTGRRQRRFGDQTGAGRPEEKSRAPLTRRHPARDALYVGQPVALVRHWIAAADSGHLASLLPLYAPHAVLHAPDGTHRGRGAIGDYLAGSGLLTRGWSARPVGSDRAVVAVRQQSAPDAGRSCHFRIAHGQIVEQWDEPPPDADRRAD